MNWWSTIKGWFSDEASITSPSEASAQWLAADDPDNPFNVPILDLMVTQSVVATSQAPEAASRAVSWPKSIGDELDTTHAMRADPIICDRHFDVAPHLPEGLLYEPPSMDAKWVLAWRPTDDRCGQIIAARSWTGEVHLVATAQRRGTTLYVDKLRIIEDSPLLSIGDPVVVFEWMIRCHALGEKLPLPISESIGELYAAQPLTAFALFGNVIFCASHAWAPPVESRPLRSNGRLIRAVRSSAIDAVQAAVTNGEPIDAPSTLLGYTALHLAIARREWALAERLLAEGANPNVLADKQAHAAVLAVVARAPVPFLESMLDLGARLDQPNADGFGPLHAAAESDNADIIPWLVEHRLDLEAKTKFGHTPFHVACGLGHLRTAKALLAVGADARATAQQGSSALQIAQREGRTEIVAWLKTNT